MRFDEARANRVCRFLERLRHVKGEWARRRELISLGPWQCWVITTVFGWIRPDGTRRFRKGYSEIARGNAKSTVSSGLGLYMLAADGEEGAEVCALARNRNQAKIVWEDAQAMVRKDPDLRRVLGIEAGAEAIVCVERNASFKPLTGNPGDGIHASCGIVDEYHQHKTDRAYEAMYQGQGTRAQPLMWVITTAGFDRSGPCYREREYARKVVLGQIKDDSVFCAIYTLDSEDDWSDENVWIKANPNLGVSVSLDQLREACLAAQHNTVKQVGFQTKRCNLWVGAGTPYFNVRLWEGGAQPELSEESLHGRPAYIGLDLASRIDLASLALLVDLGNDCWAYFGRHYLPEETVRENADGSHAHFAAWEIDGWVTLTPGSIIDYAAIKEDLRALNSAFEVKSIGYDPNQANQLATEMLTDGLPMVQINQSVLHLSPPMKELEGWIAAGKIAHNGDPVMTWAIGNVISKPNNKEEVFPRKAVPENKIDPAVALLIAINRALLREPDETGDLDGFLSAPVVI